MKSIFPHVRWLASEGSVRVGTVWCVGRNYVKHAAELGNDVPEEPLIFLKAATAVRPLTAPGSPFAHADEELHHEAELVLLIGEHIPLGGPSTRAQLRAAVHGVALGLDITRRTHQTELKQRGLPWHSSKSFAGAAPVSEFVREFELGAIEYSLAVNGERRQYARAEDMIFEPLQLLRHLSLSHELLPGDLVFTGTPEGVGPIRRGDRFELAFERGAHGRFEGEL